jgi:hypothetical protein
MRIHALLLATAAALSSLPSGAANDMDPSRADVIGRWGCLMGTDRGWSVTYEEDGYYTVKFEKPDEPMWVGRYKIESNTIIYSPLRGKHNSVVTLHTRFEPTQRWKRVLAVLTHNGVITGHCEIL